METRDSKEQPGSRRQDDIMEPENITELKMDL